MISDNDNINYYQIAKTLESAEKNLKDIKDIKYHLESGVKSVTDYEISNIDAYMIDDINLGIESSVLGVSLKRASESMKSLSNAFPPLSGKVKKGGK